MGYDYFALIGLAEEPTDEEFESMEHALKELRKDHQGLIFGDEPLFGMVHHLSSGGFDDYWWKLFNESMERLYKKTNIETFYLYVCEYDGESLTKYEYVKGKKDKETEITMTLSDPNISYIWDIKNLSIGYNITIYYNGDYHYEYY